MPHGGTSILIFLVSIVRLIFSYYIICIVVGTFSVPTISYSLRLRARVFLPFPERDNNF